MLPPFVSFRRLALASLATGACILNPAAPVFAEPSSGPPGAAAGYWVYVDPQTGERSASAPADAAAAMAADPAFSTSAQGLVERPAPGGGTVVDLQGRFKNATVFTIGPDGKASVDCAHPVAGRSER